MSTGIGRKGVSTELLTKLNSVNCKDGSFFNQKPAEEMLNKSFLVKLVEQKDTVYGLRARVIYYESGKEYDDGCLFQVYLPPRYLEPSRYQNLLDLCKDSANDLYIRLTGLVERNNKRLYTYEFELQHKKKKQHVKEMTKVDNTKKKTKKEEEVDAANVTVLSEGDDDDDDSENSDVNDFIDDEAEEDDGEEEEEEEEVEVEVYCSENIPQTSVSNVGGGGGGVGAKNQGSKAVAATASAATVINEIRLPTIPKKNLKKAYGNTVTYVDSASDHEILDTTTGTAVAAAFKTKKQRAAVEAKKKNSASKQTLVKDFFM